jgi:hypothetical protein
MRIGSIRSLCLIGFLGAVSAPQAATFTVSKDGRGAFSTIGAAMAKAGKGDVIEILDAAVYAEQVTIDSNHAGLTLRSSNPASPQKPVIRWKDVADVSPKSCAEAKNPALAGQYETNGALRILRTRNIMIDGVSVNGGGIFPFGQNGTWAGTTDCQWPLQHGNAAIAIVVSGDVVVRNSELDSAYFGINVKDRNEGGIFANPNPADIEPYNVVPLSGFGKTGNHLFERNRIHHNSFGMFFESVWDLGSVVRYNLFYENHHPPARIDEITKLTSDGVNHAGGAMLFKDQLYSPLAIYNNTFWHNFLIFSGVWQAGGVHLVFNNIYAEPYAYWGSVTNLAAGMNTAFDPILANRTFNCVYAAQVQAPAPQLTVVQAQDYDQATQINVLVKDTIPNFQTRIMNNFGDIERVDTTVTISVPLSAGPVLHTQTQTNITRPGNRIIGAAGKAFPAASNVRWLETRFQSTDPANPNFLVPDWTDPEMKQYLVDQGWPGANIHDADGSPADLGAVPMGGYPADNVLIRPIDPVSITGATAIARFDLRTLEGSIQNATLKYYRFLKVPLQKDVWGPNSAVLPASAALTPTPTAVRATGNSITATLAAPLGATDYYGFIEAVAEGTGSNGKSVSTSVGFIPYRKLDYIFVVKVFDSTNLTTALTQVEVGKTYVLELTPRKVGDPTAFTGTVNPVAVDLVSGADLFQAGTSPFAKVTYPTGVTSVSRVLVVFTKVPEGGIEYVRATGTWTNGTAQKTAFAGTSNAIKILAGPPAKVIFQNPPSKILNPGSTPVVDPGSDYPVKLVVTDVFDNRVSAPAPVSIKSLQPLIGDIAGTATASTDSTGTVGFNAKVTQGAKDDIFTLEATLVANGKTDQADLKVGKPRGKIWVLYSDTVAFVDSTALRGQVGQRLPVKLRVSTDGSIVIDTAKGTVTLALSAGLAAYATPNAAVPITQAAFVKGEATIYVTGLAEVANGNIDVTTTDVTLLKGYRERIYFTAPPVKIVSAAYFADNGFGRVNRLEMLLSDTLLWAPDSLSLHWPDVTSPALRATGITIDPANKKHLTAVLAAPFPAGITAQAGTANLGTLYTPNPAGATLPSLATGFAIADSVGPLLDTAAVQIQYDSGNAVLEISFTEKIAPASLTGASLQLIKAGSPAALPLTVLAAVPDGTGKGFMVTVQAAANPPVAGDSLKINPAGPLTDLFGNKAHALNRPVVLNLKILPPPALSVVSAAYFADNGFGRVDRAEIHMRKDLTAVPDSAILSWPDDIVASKTVRTGITWDPADKKHVTIAFAADPFPAGITASRAASSPGSLFTRFPMAGAPRQVTPMSLLDSVGPLLDSAMVREKIEPGTDTLFLAFSEPIAPASLAGASLILIKAGTPSASMPLSITAMQAAPAGGYAYRVTVADLGALAPVAGDSLKLNSAGPLVDAHGNKAHALNRPVYLRIKATPRPATLAVRADHPFVKTPLNEGPDFVVLANSSGLVWTPIQGSAGNATRDCAALDCGGAVTGDDSGHIGLPAITLETDRPVHYALDLFTNLGELVNGFSGEVSPEQLGWDANGVPVPGAGVYKRDAHGLYHIKIAWNGRSRQRSRAGTGAYLARATLQGTAKDGNNRTYPIEKTKVIRFGFLRQ